MAFKFGKTFSNWMSNWAKPKASPTTSQPSKSKAPTSKLGSGVKKAAIAGISAGKKVGGSASIVTRPRRAAPYILPAKKKPKQGYALSSDLYVAAYGSPLAQGLLKALQHEGKPSHVSNMEYMKRFARAGWHPEETDQANKVLKLWGGNGELRNFYRLQGDQTPEPTAVPLEPIDKAVNTIEALQAVADDYALIEALRQTDPEQAKEKEAEFEEKHGLKLSDAAWFADEGVVGLDEMFAMVLTAEGGSIAQSEELIVLLANRAHTFIQGAKTKADDSELDFADFSSAEALLAAYNGDDADAKEVARRIINNIFAHDDSFFGARDFPIPGQNAQRTEEEVQIAWQNLTQDPSKIGSRLGDTILTLATQLANPDQWDKQNNRFIDGRAIFTQANQTLVPDVTGLNQQLSTFGLGSVIDEPVAGGGYAVFLNFCQNLVRQRLGQGQSEEQIRQALRDNGCIE